MTNPNRLASMLAMLRDGATLAAIGAAHGVTRQRAGYVLRWHAGVKGGGSWPRLAERERMDIAIAKCWRAGKGLLGISAIARASGFTASQVDKSLRRQHLIPGFICRHCREWSAHTSGRIRTAQRDGLACYCSRDCEAAARRQSNKGEMK